MSSLQNRFSLDR